MNVHPCTIDDAEDIYRCRIDSTTVKWSFLPPPASLKEHINWFKTALESGRYSYYKGVTSKDEFIGFVRFERTELGIDVSICLSREYRGFGLSKVLVQEAINQFISAHGEQRYYTQIMIGNVASFRLFAELREQEKGEREQE
jgi:RimJ/RimL family protein N-acetyltransferase